VRKYEGLNGQREERKDEKDVGRQYKQCIQQVTLIVSLKIIIKVKLPGEDDKHQDVCHKGTLCHALAASVTAFFSRGSSVMERAAAEDCARVWSRWHVVIIRNFHDSLGCWKFTNALRFTLLGDARFECFRAKVFKRRQRPLERAARLCI